MADSSNPMTAGSPTRQTTPANAARQPQRRLADVETPGMVTFAATMLMLLGTFQFAWALIEFFNAPWIASTAYGTFNGHLWLWGIVDIAFALATLYAGFSVLIGGRFGQVYGVIVAVVGATRWFFYLPAVPVLALVMIAVAVLVIYALMTHEAYFAANSQTL